MKRIDVCCICDIGLKRSNNEDNFYFNGKFLPVEHDGLQRPLVASRSLRRASIWGVFDGMGGEQHGEIASYLAASNIMNVKIVPKQSPTDFFYELVSSVNSIICDKTTELKCNRMGTTAVMCYVKNSYLTLCNIGDSKGFRYRDDDLYQMSVDHNENQYVEYINQFHKAALTQHLGISPDDFEIVPHIITSEMRSGDIYLLCSDGLSDMLSKRAIKTILRANNDIKITAQRLLDEAMHKGGNDNCTFILIRVS